MDRVLLKELNMKTRKEVLIFLKKLWNEEETHCPICGDKLELEMQSSLKIHLEIDLALQIILSKE